jgi:hypothetical protein
MNGFVRVTMTVTRNPVVRAVAVNAAVAGLEVVTKYLTKKALS